ncbi:MAG: ACT domain-containing protein [Desulfobacterales bacterium]|jgi:hypothetical protein
MGPRKISLKILPDRMAVSRFEPSAPLPDWIDKPGFYSITRTAEELSVVCSEERVPAEVESETGWRCFQLSGPFDFSEIGIISSLTQPLTESGVSVFVISTFDTDYLMVKEEHFTKTIDVLTAQGHQVQAKD